MPSALTILYYNWSFNAFKSLFYSILGNFSSCNTIAYYA